jgi:catechol 2,3-dioxygenase-like lactoylglutathione lyase family enzyme
MRSTERRGGPSGPPKADLKVRLYTVAMAAALVAGTATSSAQLSPPNAAGVAMGHLHYQVKDVEAQKRFWTALGGQPIAWGEDGVGIKLPGVLLRLTVGKASGGSDGSVVNHVAFRVPSFAGVEASGLSVQRLQQFPGVGSVMTPDGERIELFEDAATNLAFTPDTGPLDALALRHSRPVPPPIAFHHIHLNVPAGAVAEAKAWYARLFGGTPGKRSNYDAVDLPGVNINISAAPKPVTGTAGRALDRIGFEVDDLRVFEMRLKAMNMSFEQEVFTPERMRYGSRTLVDPWGTVIELTQGLRRY